MPARRRVPSVEEWRRRRNQAGTLLYIIAGIPRSGRREAWRVYREWQENKVSYEEARRRLKALAGEAEERDGR